MKQKFPTWWQALLLFVGGIIIFFSSCASALSGIGGGGGQRLPQNLIAAGLLIGAGMTVVGVVLGIVVIILALVGAASSKREPAVTSHVLPSGAVVSVPRASGTRQTLDIEQSILWRLRVTIIISMIFSGTGFWSALFMMNRRYSNSNYLEYFLVSYVLTQVPYIIALVRTAHRADRVGVSIALAASIFYLGLWGLGVYRYLRFYTVLSMWALTPILDILVLVFAWQASRIHPLEEKEKELVGAVFFAVGVYSIALHFGLVHARGLFLR